MLGKIRDGSKRVFRGMGETDLYKNQKLDIWCQTTFKHISKIVIVLM